MGPLASEHGRHLLVPVLAPRHVLHHVALLCMFDLQRRSARWSISQCPVIQGEQGPDLNVPAVDYLEGGLFFGFQVKCSEGCLKSQNSPFGLILTAGHAWSQLVTSNHSWYHGQISSYAEF